MKLSLATLGCPDWPLEQIIDTAGRLGYDGIEFRGILRELDLANVPEFAPAQIADTRKRLEDAGLQASCLSSSVQIVASTATEIDRRTAIAHAKRYIQMAKEIGAPCVRLFCGNVPTTKQRGEALDGAAESLREIGDFAREREVIAVVETHDAFIRTEQLMELIQLTNHPAVQVLWDLHHPYRVAGESIAHSLHYLDGHVKHTHVKDSVPNPNGEGFSYVLTGAGDIPIQEAILALKEAQYHGFLSFEWEKRWLPDLPDPEVAIPQYIEQMRAWFAEM